MTKNITNCMNNITQTDYEYLQVLRRLHSLEAEVGPVDMVMLELPQVLRGVGRWAGARATDAALRGPVTAVMVALEAEVRRAAGADRGLRGYGFAAGERARAMGEGRAEVKR